MFVNAMRIVRCLAAEGSALRAGWAVPKTDGAGEGMGASAITMS